MPYLKKGGNGMPVDTFPIRHGSTIQFFRNGRLEEMKTDLKVYILRTHTGAMYYRGAGKWTTDLNKAKKYKRKCDAGNALTLLLNQSQETPRKSAWASYDLMTFRLIFEGTENLGK